MYEQAQSPVSQNGVQAVPPVQTSVSSPVGDANGSSGSHGKFILISLGVVLLIAATAGITYWLMNRENVTDTEDVVEEDTSDTVDDGSNVSEDADEEEEETSGTQDDETPGTETREFVVEYWEGDGGVITLEADVPQDAIIEQGNYSDDEIWGTNVGTKIKYNNFEIFFWIPHMGGVYEYERLDELESDYLDNLYRVIVSKGEAYAAFKFYVVDPVLTGMCENPFGDDVDAPCGDLLLKVTDEGGIDSVYVKYSGVDEKTVQADEIVQTVRFVEN